jgi:hypothetical protein
MGRDLDGRFLEYGARVIRLVEALPKTVAGKRIGDQFAVQHVGWCSVGRGTGREVDG